jgi:hypothetical protein
MNQKLVKNLSTAEDRKWWKKVAAAAAQAPKLKPRKPKKR